MGDRFRKQFDPVDHRPERLLVDRGVPGQGRIVFRYILQSDTSPTGTFAYRAEKARDLEMSLGES